MQWRLRGSSLPKPSLLGDLRETQIKFLNYHVNRSICLLPVLDSSSVVNNTAPIAPNDAKIIGTITPFFRPNLVKKHES